MFSCSRMYCKLLNLALRTLVKFKSIPAEPKLELGLDISRPIMYVLHYSPKTDLRTIRIQCLIHNLPDPLKPLEVNGTVLPRYVFIYGRQQQAFTYHRRTKEATMLFHDYLKLHHKNSELDVQIVPISITFNHPSNHQKGTKNPLVSIFNRIKNFFTVSWLGNNGFVRFFPSISLRQIAHKHGTDEIIAQKLTRIACMHFARYTSQHLINNSSYLQAHEDIFNKLLASKTIVRAIADEARSKKISYEKAQQNAIALMKEIAAKFSYGIFRLTDRILGFIWNRLYQVINVHNAEIVHQLVNDGHGIVYVPCHRSHMDYLLLSYVLYHQGLVPPHIAAGINLNFWPAGAIFRRLGAFFIRRTFKINKLYTTVFREYLGELFMRGYSVEYFIEGGRSRTGRLLEPKTGTLLMTIKAMLRSSNRPITLVPIYIGYEHVIEVDTYAKELLHGATKEKESLSQVLRSLIKLRNLGQGYVNFGEPIQLIIWLNHYVPKWRESIDPIETVRPVWLTPTVNNIAAELMVRINNACAANAMNLCCTALLASRQHWLTRKQLTKQLECYLNIMRNAPYSNYSTAPNATATQLIDHALKINKFKFKKDDIGDIVIITREQTMLMTYYRNNIAHMLMLPSMIATIVTQHGWVTRNELLRQVELLYPILKSELFLRWRKDELAAELDKLTAELLRQGLLAIKNNKIKPTRSSTLKLLAAGASETLQRYAITFWLLNSNPLIKRDTLEIKSRTLAQRLSMLHGINTLEFFDKTIFSSLVLTLRDEGYISAAGGTETEEKTLKVYHILAKLIASDVRLTIESSLQNE